jgi:hypothetical protein
LASLQDQAHLLSHAIAFFRLDGAAGDTGTLARVSVVKPGAPDLLWLEE